MTCIFAERKLDGDCLFALAYDDIKSIAYFGEPLDAYWKTVDPDIIKAVCRAYRDYGRLMKKCRLFSEKLVREATAAGGERYAELLMLSLRQSVAAHKLVVDPDGELLFISKECFSNGCAARLT